MQDFPKQSGICAWAGPDQTGRDGPEQYSHAGSGSGGGLLKNAAPGFRPPFLHAAKTASRQSRTSARRQAPKNPQRAVAEILSGSRPGGFRPDRPGRLYGCPYTGLPNEPGPYGTGQRETEGRCTTYAACVRQARGEREERWRPGRPDALRRLRNRPASSQQELLPSSFPGGYPACPRKPEKTS